MLRTMSGRVLATKASGLIGLHAAGFHPCLPPGAAAEAPCFRFACAAPPPSPCPPGSSAAATVICRCCCSQDASFSSVTELPEGLRSTTASAVAGPRRSCLSPLGPTVSLS